MEKEKEDWLKILNHLNTFGFKPYDEIAAWGKHLYEDEEQFKIVFIQMYEDDLVIQDRNKPLPFPGDDYLHKYLMGISQPGKLRMQALKHEKDSEQSIEKGTREVSGWTKWGAIGAWVAAGLTLIAIIVTIYLAYYPPKPTYVTKDNILEPLQVDTNAVRTDTAKIKIVKDCCNAEDSLEPKPPEIKSKDTIK
jgi:hypothetical protein